jgi:hypothetical protein
MKSRCAIEYFLLFSKMWIFAQALIGRKEESQKESLPFPRRMKYEKI